MRSLLFVALLAAAPLAQAEVPARVFPSAHDTGFTREQPQAMSHWQKMAQDMADRAAPALKAHNVTLSASADGKASVFDAAFHDFFITALFDRGVQITRNGYGARLEIDTYPLAFYNSRTTVAAPDKSERRRFNRAAQDEFAVNLRVFDGGDLVFSGSTTYYLSAEDLAKYRLLFEPTRADQQHGAQRRMSGDYGTRTWGR